MSKETANRYNRTANICDLYDRPMAGARGEVLEIGVGTGRNLQVLLRNHLRPDNKGLGPLFDLVSPITCRGFHVNRTTEDNIITAGPERRSGVWREIYASTASLE